MFVGTFTVKDVKPTPEGDSAKVKVKVRVTLNGIFTISSASLVEKLPASENDTNEEQSQPEPMEASPSPANDNVADNENSLAEVRLGTKTKSPTVLDLAERHRKLIEWFYLVCVVSLGSCAKVLKIGLSIVQEELLIEEAFILHLF